MTDTERARAISEQVASTVTYYMETQYPAFMQAHSYSARKSLKVTVQQQVEMAVLAVQCETHEADARVAETPIAGEQDDITRQACDGIAARIRALNEAGGVMKLVKPSLQPQNISETAWYYEYPNCIEVIVEVRDNAGNCIAETQTVRVPWRKLIASLKRCKP